MEGEKSPSTLQGLIMSYGVLRSAANTGNDNELLCKFAAPISIISNSPTFSGDTMSLKRVRSRQPAQRWEIETKIAQDIGLNEFFINMVVAGSSDTIFIRMPQIYSRGSLPKGTVMRTISAAAAGANSLQVSGGTFSPGEFITFTGDSKVYTVKEQIGNTLSIFPDLRSAKSTNTIITHSDNVVMRVTYDPATVHGIVYVDGVLVDIGAVRFIEDL